MSNQMNAVEVRAFGGPEVLRLSTVSLPQVGPGQVLIRVRAASVNPIDTAFRAGVDVGAPLPPLPWTPGVEAAGEVAAVGEGVKNVTVGQRVFTGFTLTGTYAEYALAHSSQVFPLPERLSFAQGAGITSSYLTGYHTLFHLARAVAGETVLIHGASGGVGIATLQWARASGLRVIASAGTEQGRELVRREGAHLAVEHKGEAARAAIHDFTGGRGPDIVIEMKADNLPEALNVVANRGRIVVVGGHGSVPLDATLLIGKAVTILGTNVITLSLEMVASIQAAISAAVDAGTIRPVVAEEIGLDNAGRAHERIASGGALGKVVLRA